ncbi:putative glycerol-3-phosphate dehydrogenase 2 [NAD(P)+] [bacterium MnTg02]|nr:putative glycerol-3-phosphate dehydrogenase 2 [NAD(P)+] [bacterium MnTg02]
MIIDHIGVIGGGAWGTALALTALRAGRRATLWAVEPETIENINTHHENRTYLPGISLDPELRATNSLSELADCDALLIVTPAQFVRPVSRALAAELTASQPIVICAKGIEQSTGQLMSEVLGETLPRAPLAVLSGPSFAIEVARGLPTAVTLACQDRTLGEALSHGLGHKNFRPYWTDDITGAEVGGAIKNVLAIAAGIADGKAFGASAHAALTTRGFVELVQLGKTLGGRVETLSGLSGLGDLFLTCSSPQSRNMSLGRALGQGQALDDILSARASVTEGVYTAAAIMDIAGKYQLDLPICRAVENVISGKISVDDAIEGLLSRPFRSET